MIPSTQVCSFEDNLATEAFSALYWLFFPEAHDSHFMCLATAITIFEVVCNCHEIAHGFGEFYGPLNRQPLHIPPLYCQVIENPAFPVI